MWENRNIGTNDFDSSGSLPGKQRKNGCCTNTKSTTTTVRAVIGMALVLLLAVSTPMLVTAETESASGGDDYVVAEGHKSLLVALGCFWCAEQAFEQYAPGVIEAVSGYAGGINQNPTYRNHPGHYEVILIEYDPSKTSYEVLVNYAYRNMDPFDGTGQFCDKGSSYYPAIFYETEAEQAVAEEVLAEILEQYDWTLEDIAAPILPRPVFWTAETYHQDYYLKNPSNYGFYKNACRRPQRLKEVWGEDEYKCYHDEDHSCFVIDDMMDGVVNDTSTTTTTATATAQVVNADGELVAAESNIKNAGAEIVGVMPRWAIIVVSIVGALLVCATAYYMLRMFPKAVKK